MGELVGLQAHGEAREWLDTLVSTLQKYSFSYTNEDELQQGVFAVLETLKEPFEREYVLSKSDRVDFYFPKQKVGIEAKIDHSLSALTRQIHRYVQHEEIDGILVVSGKVRLMNLPESINKKPVRCYSLIGSLL